MQTTEPPSSTPSRPNLFSPARCSSDVQQQILARLELKAAEKARMMRMARQSLRVASLTTAGIGVVVAMLVVARHRNAAPLPVVRMVAAPAPARSVPLAPLPALRVDQEQDRLVDGALAALLEAQREVQQEAQHVPRAPELSAPAVPTVVRVVAPAPRRKLAPLLQQLAHLKNKHADARTASAKSQTPPKATAITKPLAAPVDTDANLLAAILLHSSRPAVVPAALQRAPCGARNAQLPAQPCAEPVPDP